MTTSNGKSGLKQTQRIQDRKLNSLYRLLVKNGERNLLWYYQLGKRVKAIHPFTEVRPYSKNVIQTLAIELREKGVKRYNEVPLATLLWDARRFVNLFKRADVERLVQQASQPKKHPLSWSHVRLSMSIKDEAQRARLLDRCICNGWPSRRFHQKVKDANAKKNQFRPSGRAPIEPRSGLKDVIDRSAQWLGRCNRIWFPVVVALKKAKRVANKKLLTTTQEKLQEVIATTQKLAKDIKESNAEFKRRSMQGKPKAAPKKRRASPKR